MAKNLTLFLIWILLLVSCKPCKTKHVKQDLPNTLFTGGANVYTTIYSDSGLTCTYFHSLSSKWEPGKAEDCKITDFERRSYGFGSIYLYGNIELYFQNDSVILAFKPDYEHKFRFCLNLNVNLKGQILDKYDKVISNIDSKISLDTLTDFNGHPLILKFTVEDFGYVSKKSDIKEYYLHPSMGMAYARTNDNIFWSLFH